MGCLLYEDERFQQSSQCMLRPGGMDLTWEAVEMAGFQPGCTLLDAGCGLGTTVAQLSAQGFSASGLERSPALLGRAKNSHPQLLFKQGDLCSIPWPDEYFEGVLCECSLSTVTQLPTALREIHRVLMPHGVLAVSDFYQREAFEPPRQMEGSCLGGAVTAETTRLLMRDHGFTQSGWQDATEHLRTFTASLVWNYGSLKKLHALLLSCEEEQAPSEVPWALYGYAISSWEKVELHG
ncbi:class I SAM-dependent methyltransferase [Ruminococcaceae bacterium OttesenSCG-928-I18]|nr:class I SAM-dependent methyltransferase [Ruminococcaceae bacterium OttesenSCG-928-I18]